MSLLFAESRAITDLDSFGVGGRTPSVISPMRLIPFYGAVTGIADDVSITPWHGYRSNADGLGQRLTPAPALLTDPGIDIDFISWMGQAVMSALVHGFACGVVVARTGGGGPSKVVWADPEKVTIDETGPRVRFLINGVHVDTGDILYVPGPVLPGSIKGLSPVRLFRMQFSKQLAAQKYAWQAFDRGIMPPGVLRNNSRVVDPAQARVAKEQFSAAVSGREIFVTGKDWEWSQLTIPNDDAAFLETIRAGATEIATIFRVAPEDIGGETGKSMTYQTVELNELKRQRRALLPWIRRFEHAFGRQMAPGQYVKANLDALVRVDLNARTTAQVARARAGLDTNAEIRRLEDKAPLTPEQIAEWKAMYGSGAADTEDGDPEALAARRVAELVQKIYLGVGKVLSADEAREIANRAGAGLDGPFTPGGQEA